ncbi:unnamed protein product [Schistosoma mattheei]|uniref:Uncharacterized protein n=1 Tax=Schistosoma mattheei TaxID=31246 RepID=A0A183PT02_9TREM|nr:unnamed protein product [Schistosoma mattheei]
MWEALQDLTLIVLIVAAFISLALSLYIKYGNLKRYRVSCAYCFDLLQVSPEVNIKLLDTCISS